MSDKQKFSVLYHLLEGEAEDIYNRHSSERDDTLTLNNVRCALEKAFGYRNPLTEMNERSARPVHHKGHVYFFVRRCLLSTPCWF